MLRLSKTDREVLLTLARQAVRTSLVGRPPERVEVPEGPLRDPAGVFVSLHQSRRLRGCIGRIQSERWLAVTTMDCAVAAATDDPRFPPLGIDEFEETTFEISVLSTLEPVENPGRIEVGRHGLLVEFEQRHGLLLPQVAAEHGWDRIRFIEETCIKAGLDPGAWQQGATLRCFEALVFGEEARP